MWRICVTPILIPLKPTSIILKNKKIINIKTHSYILKKNMKNIYIWQKKKKNSSLPDELDSDFFFFNEKERGKEIEKKKKET